MKKFICKNISVILSFALVLGLLLPCLSGVTASAYTPENTQVKTQLDSACDSLIAEWKTMAGEEALPFGIEDMTPYELFDEAQSFNVSGYENTADFLAAKQGLATLLANSFDPTALKEAWAKMYRVNAIDFLHPFAIINGDNNNDDNGYSDALYFREDAEGVTVNYTDEENQHLFGEKTATFDYALGMNRTNTSAGDNRYTVFISNDPEVSDKFGATKRVHGIDELQFSFVVNKINTAATGMKLGFRITGEYGGGYGVRNTNTYIDINEDMLGEVVTVKFSELAKNAGMSDWETALSTGGGSIGRIEIQLCDTDSANNASVNITVGSMVALNISRMPSEAEAADWTVSDWIYAASGVDTTDYYGTEDFVNALNNAIELREISGIEKNSNVETIESLNDASFLKYGDNLLSGLTPFINYYDGVSERKEDKFTADFKDFADGNLSASATVEDVDFSNAGSFVELIYDLERVNVLNTVAVASAANTALRNYKYKLYAAKSEGELFTDDSLLTTYINRDNSAVQVYDYSAGLEISARYFAIRIYTPATDMTAFDNIVRLNELGVYGTVRDYDVNAGEFSSAKIKNLGSNLLENGAAVPYVRANTGNRQKFTGLFDVNNYPLEYVLDGDIETAIAVSGNYRMLKAGDTTSLHIYFDLGKVYSIDKLLFSSSNIPYAQTGKYKIHASNDLNELFTEKSVVAQHDNTTESTVMQIFNMKSDVAARYVSFHITLAMSDYENFMAPRDPLYSGAFIRITELGVYGEEYKKPSNKENLLTHVPVEVNRVDEGGNKTAIEKSEYSGKKHALTYDGDYETAVSVDTNGKKVEYIYNLYAASTVDSIRVVTARDNVTEMKFYASSVKSAIDSESSLVYSYNSANDGQQTVFSKTFVEAPLRATFVKIVVATSDGSFDPTEIEVIGWDQGKPQYENLVLNRSDLATYFIQNIKTKAYSGVTEHMDKWLPSWSVWEDYQHAALAFDGDLGTVYTYYGGVNNSHSVSIFIRLKTLSCVDNVSVYTSLLEDYRPSKMNVYVGNSRDELFAADATPVMQWTEKILDDDDTVIDDDVDLGQGSDEGEFGEDEPTIDFENGSSGFSGEGVLTDKYLSKTPEDYGLYEADFTPCEISCVRIEIVESAPKYFAHLGKVGGIISEIQVNGFEVVQNAADNVIQTAEEMSMRAFDPIVYNDATTDIINETYKMGSLNGEPIFTVNGIGDNVGYSSCNPSYGYVEFRSTSGMTGDVTLADIEDIYFSYKVEKAYSSGEAAARIYIYDGAGKCAMDFASTGTGTVLFIPTDNNGWVHTSMSEVTGDNWKDALTASFNTTYGYSGDDSLTKTDISISKIRLGFNKSAQADITFSSMYYEFNAGCNPYANAITGKLGINGQTSALNLSSYVEGDSDRVTANTVKENNADEYTVINGIGDTVGAPTCNASSGAVIYEATSNGKNITLADIEDIYFSYKVNKAYSGRDVAARIYIYDQSGKLARSFAVTGTSTVFYLPLSNTDWTQTSIGKVAGASWKEILLESFNENYETAKTEDEITISKIILGFNQQGAADVSFGQMYYERSGDANTFCDVTTAVATLNNARKFVDATTAKREDAVGYLYSVQMLADILDMPNGEVKYMSGDYNKTAPTMKELAILAQYLDKALSKYDYIDLNCADVNGDGVINEADLIALRKQLIG